MCNMHIHIFGQKCIIPPTEFICIYNFLLSQTLKDIRGKLCVGTKEQMTFFGQVRLNSLHSIHREVKVKGNFSHQLEVNKHYKTNKNSRASLTDAVALSVLKF